MSTQTRIYLLKKSMRTTATEMDKLEEDIIDFRNDERWLKLQVKYNNFVSTLSQEMAKLPQKTPAKTISPE